MGVYISTPFLVNIVARNGALGTVSGVAAERILALALGQGDVGGHYRRALSHFPFPDIAREVLDAFYIEKNNPLHLASRNVPAFTIDPPRILIALTICASYAFVYLAKEGHDHPVSINYMEKLAMPHIYAITGAMLAGVDVITMGAGIPLQIPEVMDSIAQGRTATYRVPVAGTDITHYDMRFDPEAFFGSKLPFMRKPMFIPIIASNALASILADKLPPGSIYGFVIEGPTAGGHNAPPRKNGIYGPKDEVDYAKIAKLGLPFWIGGGMASPEKLKWARSIGAAGVQVGTIFALCEESGYRPSIRVKLRELGFTGKLDIEADMHASPTGFPIELAELDGSLSEESVYRRRKRVCDQGALRTLFQKPDDTIGCRCPAEPVRAYVAKGGDKEKTKGAFCVCNALIANTCLGDEEKSYMITLGQDVSFLRFLMDGPGDFYSAVEALRYLQS
jgi:NAD(P)H-dependent flavin oxidoreductase YrpB (nitropropane dioxygenase family)